MFDGGNANQDATATLLCMEPDRFGRKLGVGVRVASGMLRDRASQTAHSMQKEAPAYVERAAQQSAERGRSAARGVRKFGQGIWGPFAHASGVLWLEVTGLFFALFGLFFAQSAYKLRHAWWTGGEHTRFMLYLAVTVVFFYFTFSSFYRARVKEKKRKAQ
ncbi:MAG: hypothetical protein WAK33_20500 [Silvibacterium sp.]